MMYKLILVKTREAVNRKSAKRTGPLGRTAAESAGEKRVKQFFSVLVEVEEDHISLSNRGLGIA